MTQPSTAAAHNRLTQLDLMRFAAAFAVMFFHFTTRGNVDPNLIPVQYPWMSQISRYGYLGVDLFFMISGFVIFMSAVNRTAAAFAISRIVRLYPAYWVCCTLTFAVTLFWGVEALKVSWLAYAVNMTMLHDFLGIEHVDGVYWSLIVEMKFYALVLILILIKQMDFARCYLGLWLAVSLLWLKFPVSAIEEVLITPHSAYFIAGAVFYLIWKQGMDVYKGILLVGSYVLALCNSFRMMQDVVAWYGIYCELWVVWGLVTGFFGVFLLLALNRLPVIHSPLSLTLGALTYPLYLLHERIGFVIFKAAAPWVNQYVLLAAVMGLALLGAYAVNVGVEQRYAGHLKRFLERWFGNNSVKPSR